MSWIKKSALIDGGVYRGIHRCGHVAIWHKRQNQFYVHSYSCGVYGFDTAPHPEDSTIGQRIAEFFPFQYLGSLEPSETESLEVGKFVGAH